jgi:peptidoglycan biosynthesis protein MviN/MurJ (putative lipid II flippase)
VSRALLWLLLLAPPVLAGMSIGRVALVKVLYGGGRFAPEHVSATAAALDAFLPGVLFSLLGALIVKAHILDGRLRLVLVLGAASFSLNALLDLVLLRFGLAGLATATSITTIVITVVSLSMLLPTLRGTVPARETTFALTLAAACGVLAGAARGVGFAPDTVLDRALWMASVPCLALLAAGAWRARQLP